MDSMVDKLSLRYLPGKLRDVKSEQGTRRVNVDLRGKV